ncbi:MAG TPA: transporter substrate-binding domain-containing protein [Burkholderiales bacterium]|nr:transporter substrate-binding domain-containing protein [Burkholderiales bacterium]
MAEQTSRRGFLRSSALGLGAGVTALAAAGCTGGVTATGPSANKLNEVLKRGTVIVGTGSTNPPWHFEDEKGDLQGFDIEMGRLLAKGLFDDPAKVQFVRQASDARVPNLQTGQVDVVFQFMTVTAQRAQLVAFSIPYYREGVGTLLRRDSAHAGALDLAKARKKIKVSILQNVYAEGLVHAAIPQAEVMQFDSVANAVLALDAGRVEAAAIDDSTVRWLVRQNPDKYKSGNYGWSPQTYAAAVRQGDPAWLNFVNTVLHESMTGVDFDAYASGFEKYFGVKLAPPPVGFPVEFGLRHT